MNALEKYQVSFYIHNPLGKSIKTINDWLSLYIGDHYYPTIANLLVNEVNSVFTGEKSYGGWDTQSLYLAKITKTTTKIYKDLYHWEENNNIAPDFELSTSDFKVIVEAWRDFLAK
ncbi:hypothetical protein [Chryseobacterium sp. MP_3.2]|uniref:hypothetical protein n=1 Tax=Chryseobacterium sp. MP_3.2 TaxID=3071712 RepID=UPI002E059074|nr:hypothetical protein [Chryseobacterium sp. MP_3.2]